MLNEVHFYFNQEKIICDSKRNNSPHYSSLSRNYLNKRKKIAKNIEALDKDKR